MFIQSVNGLIKNSAVAVIADRTAYHV